MSPDTLKLFSLFAEFSEEDREALCELLEGRTLPTGKSVFREGAEGEGLVLLETGHLTLKSQRTGAIVGRLEAPQTLGSASLFVFGKREVTALADGPCQVWVLPRSGLSRLLDDAPRAAFRLAEATAGELATLMRGGLTALVDSEIE